MGFSTLNFDDKLISFPTDLNSHVTQFICFMSRTSGCRESWVPTRFQGIPWPKHGEFKKQSLRLLYRPKLDYTCRARWPEGLLCSTISLKSCNLAQILQSPKSEIVTCVMFSTHTNTSLIKPHLTELDEIHRNRPKSNYNLAKNLQSWSFLERYIRRTDGRTHRQRFTHFLSGTPV